MRALENRFKDEKGNWNLLRIARDCEHKLTKAGIPIQKYIEVNIVRNKYLFGGVWHYDSIKYDFALDIANVYRNPKYELTEVRTVICHLLLHTVEGCMNHGEKWMEYAQKADKEYGLHIMKYMSARPKAGENWSSKDSKGKEVSNRERCCFIDYKEKLEDLMGECAEELKKMGLKIGHVSELLFWKDNDGWCRQNADNDFTIVIPPRYATEDADRFGLKSMLCHELLHTCPEDDSVYWVHGPKWREMARKVEREYGYKLMAQSDADIIRQTSSAPRRRFVCSVCGGYYDLYGKDDKVSSRALLCKWCRHNSPKMNLIKLEDMGILDNIYLMVGEWRDKMKLAGIPDIRVSGIGFVSGDKPDGLHDNWNGSFSIDLPERFRKQEMLNSDELKVYLGKELVRTCKGCDDYGEKWSEYMKKAERTLGFSIS